MAESEYLGFGRYFSPHSGYHCGYPECDDSGECCLDESEQLDARDEAGAISEEANDAAVRRILKAVRKITGLSIGEEVAARIARSDRFLSRWEKSQMLPIVALAKKATEGEVIEYHQLIKAYCYSGFTDEDALCAMAKALDELPHRGLGPPGA